MNTKGKILEAALELFSRRGFSAVSVRDIAKEVGVRESAMYKHFSGKQAVFDTLLANYMATSNAFMGGINALPSADPSTMMETAAFYQQMSDEDFLRIGGGVFTDVPTFKELGYPGIVVVESRAIAAPPAMSPEAVDYYVEMLRKVTETAEWKNDYIAKNFLDPVFYDDAKTKAFYEGQIDSFRKAFEGVDLTR